MGPPPAALAQAFDASQFAIEAEKFRCPKAGFLNGLPSVVERKAAEEGAVIALKHRVRHDSLTDWLQSASTPMPHDYFEFICQAISVMRYAVCPNGCGRHTPDPGCDRRAAKLCVYDMVKSQEGNRLVFTRSRCCIPIARDSIAVFVTRAGHHALLGLVPLSNPGQASNDHDELKRLPLISLDTQSPSLPAAVADEIAKFVAELLPRQTVTLDQDDEDAPELLSCCGIPCDQTLSRARERMLHALIMLSYTGKLPLQFATDDQTALLRTALRRIAQEWIHGKSSINQLLINLAEQLNTLCALWAPEVEHRSSDEVAPQTPAQPHPQPAVTLRAVALPETLSQASPTASATRRSSRRKT